MGNLNLIKLSVGSESVDDIAVWQARRAREAKDGRYAHVTRMWPRREAELLDGGSIYWVVQGVVQARQKITSLEEWVGSDGIRRCALYLDSELVRTEPQRKRPFQGWRYLEAKDAPRDLSAAEVRDARDVPPKLLAALAEIGVR